jgi:hypothetical protein
MEEQVKKIDFTGQNTYAGFDVHKKSWKVTIIDLIELMKPIYVYNSGRIFQDDDILDCFKAKQRNEVVKSTKSDGDLLFPC